jgi:hypothetical protein
MLRVSKKLPSVQRQVDLLESAGFEVCMRHDSTRLSIHTNAKGASFVRIFDPTGFNVGQGDSYCSKEDNYDRVIGTRIAFRRAVADFYNLVGWKKAKEVLYPKVEVK